MLSLCISNGPHMAYYLATYGVCIGSPIGFFFHGQLPALLVRVMSGTMLVFLFMVARFWMDRHFSSNRFHSGPSAWLSMGRAPSVCPSRPSLRFWRVPITLARATVSWSGAALAGAVLSGFVEELLLQVKVMGSRGCAPFLGWLELWPPGLAFGLMHRGTGWPVVDLFGYLLRATSQSVAPRGLLLSSH